MWIWNYSRDLTEVSDGVDAAGEPVNGSRQYQMKQLMTEPGIDGILSFTFAISSLYEGLFCSPPMAAVYLYCGEVTQVIPWLSKPSMVVFRLRYS